MDGCIAFGASGQAVPERGVRKIAVLRANGIGDFVFALPALDALRSAYPSAEIVLLATDWHERLLEGRPGPVDRVIPVPPSTGVRQEAGTVEDPRALDRFFERMNDESFDLALQLHGGGRHSNPFVRRLGAPLAVGLQAPDAPALDRVVPYVYFHPEVLRYLEVVSLVGASPVRLEPMLQTLASDVEESLHVVPDEDKPLAVLHPSASDTRRRWPPGRFADVARALASDGARVVVIGIEPDARLAADVVEASGGAALDACGRLSLRGLAGLLSRAAVVVSNDSGPLHLAAAVGAATVGVYWCGNLINSGPLTRTRHRPFLSWRLACPVCGVDTTKGQCDHRDSFVADVPLDEVLRAARELLALEARRPAVGTAH